MRTRAAGLLIAALAVLAGGCQTVGLRSPIAEPKQTTFEAPLAGASSVTAEFVALVSDVLVGPLGANSDQLVTADIGYIGELTATAEGEGARTLILRDVLNSYSYNGPEIRFDIRLNPALPLNLTAASASGDLRLNLTDFDLTSLVVSSASGDIAVQLPASSAAYPVEASNASGDIVLTAAPDSVITLSRVSTASGRVTVNAGDGAMLEGGNISSSSGDVELNLTDAASGSFRLVTASGDITAAVPEGSAVRLEVQSNASGSIRVPPSMAPVSGGARSGAWETANYASSEQRFLIVVTSTASGDVTVR